MGTVKCIKCAEVLVAHEPLSDLTAKTHADPRRCEMEEEDDRPFYRCPSCRAKNFVIETRSPDGFPELTVVGVG